MKNYYLYYINNVKKENKKIKKGNRYTFPTFWSKVPIRYISDFSVFFITEFLKLNNPKSLFNSLLKKKQQLIIRIMNLEFILKVDFL